MNNPLDAKKLWFPRRLSTKSKPGMPMGGPVGFRTEVLVYDCPKALVRRCRIAHPARYTIP